MSLVIELPEGENNGYLIIASDGVCLYIFIQIVIISIKYILIFFFEPERKQNKTKQNKTKQKQKTKTKQKQIILTFFFFFFFQLWDVISGQKAGQLVFNNSERTTQQMANILLKTAVGSSKCHDNVTVVVVKL